MRKYYAWKPATAIIFAVALILCFSALTQNAAAQVTDFQIKSATIHNPGHIDVTVQCNISDDSPEGLYVRVSILDSANHVMDSQKYDWPSGITEIKTFSFIGIPMRGEDYLVQVDAYSPTYLHHFLQATAKNEIRVFTNGYQLTLDVPPFISNGKTLVPLRGVFESLGAKVSWDETKQEVTIIKDEQTLILPLNQNNALKNGEQVVLDVPAQLVNGRTMVPVRFIAETLGGTVEWDANDYAIRILTGLGTGETGGSELQ
jgi:hypothetical protein